MGYWARAMTRAAVRAMKDAQKAKEREARRRQREEDRRIERELAIQLKEDMQQRQLEEAEEEILNHENYIRDLICIHRQSSKTINWNLISSTKPPNKPIRLDVNEKRARQTLDNYRPGLWDKLFIKTEKKRRLMRENIDVAKKEDDESYQKVFRKYKKEYLAWKSGHELATRILSGELGAFADAIKSFNKFRSISNLGKTVKFVIKSSRVVEVSLHVRGEDVIPQHSKTLLKSGRVSVKKMPARRFKELYQDHVCSAVLRMGREFLAMLPIDTVCVNAVQEVISGQTGQLEDKTILSVLITKEKFEKLNFDAIDPSDAINNFVYHMNFKKTEGFHPVNPIDSSTSI